MIRLAGIVVTLVLAAGGVAAEGRFPTYFFPEGDVYNVRVSPSGEWVAAAVTNGERHGVMAQRIGDAKPRVLQTATGLRADLVAWTGADTLLIRFGTGRGRRWVHVELTAGGEESFTHTAQMFPASGWLVDPLPFSDGELLWEFEHRRRNSVYRIPVAKLVAGKALVFDAQRARRLGERVAEIDGSARRWIVDGNEVVRVAVRTEDESFTVLYRASDEEDFEPIANYGVGGLDLVDPFGLTPDGTKLIVAARDKKATVGIYEFDPITRRTGRKIFGRDDLDVEGLSLDPLTGDVLSYRYSDGVETKRAYVEATRDRFANALGESDPEIESIQIVSSNAERSRFVYRTEGPTEPGAYYLRNADLDETIEAGRSRSSIARDMLADMDVFQVDSTDGLRIEALLTVPTQSGPGPFPLLVMPHGGPIGVHDRRVFRPDIQYFASWGFAVLQANYRGSSGYGSDFEKAGFREWARGIEDDLDAAITETLARADIDATRVCIIGGSYGGFSALSSALRHPDWFDCAVTINGVTDVPLMGETSDMADSQRVLDQLEKMVGDLEKERDQLLSISPAYQVEDLKTPVMVVYGDRDRRVDRDHAARLLLMLELYDLPHQEYRIEGGRHSPSRAEWIRALPAIREFFEQHMAMDQTGVGVITDAKSTAR